MYLIVVGAEPEGMYLIDRAIQDGHEITLIEPDQDKARQVLRRHNIRVLQGRISDEGILDEADAGRADAIATTTPDDAVNLMAMMLGRDCGITTLVAIVRQPHHQKLFQQMGVRVLTNPANIVAGQLYEFVQT